MKAAVVPTLGAPLEIREVPIPTPGPGQVLVRIETCGLCHTDIHAARGEWPVKPKDLLIPGHEGVGLIEAVGEGDLPVAVGQRVALPWLGHACGHCRYCVDGWETYCTNPFYHEPSYGPRHQRQVLQLPPQQLRSREPAAAGERTATDHPIDGRNVNRQGSSGLVASHRLGVAHRAGPGHVLMLVRRV